MRGRIPPFKVHPCVIPVLLGKIYTEMVRPHQEIVDPVQNEQHEVDVEQDEQDQVHNADLEQDEQEDQVQNEAREDQDVDVQPAGAAAEVPPPQQDVFPPREYGMVEYILTRPYVMELQKLIPPTYDVPFRNLAMKLDPEISAIVMVLIVQCCHTYDTFMATATRLHTTLNATLYEPMSLNAYMYLSAMFWAAMCYFRSYEVAITITVILGLLYTLFVVYMVIAFTMYDKRISPHELVRHHYFVMIIVTQWMAVLTTVTGYLFAAIYSLPGAGAERLPENYDQYLKITRFTRGEVSKVAVAN